MDEVILANVDYLVSRCGGYVDDYGNVLDADGNPLATLTELATPGFTPATVPHE